MKKINIYASLFALLFGASFTLQAQNPGCDGTRYLQDVFSNVKMTTVDYATATSHTGFAITLKMDVYEPEGDAITQRPAVVLAHGGSFVFGDKGLMKPYCELLAKKGYVAVSIQYRLFPFLILGAPDSTKIMDTAVKAMGDMKAAVRFLREDAATQNKFRIDPAYIFIGGYSAGAVTALHTGYISPSDSLPDFLTQLIANNGGLEGNSGSASNQTYSSASSAVLNMSGGLYRRAWVQTGDAPLVSIHGTADATVPYNTGLADNVAYLEGSGVLHPRAVQVGVPSYLETVQGAGHTNLYSAAQYATQLASFWSHAAEMLEGIICAPVPTHEIVAEQAAWSVYPNPSAGEISLRLPEGTERVDLKIYDQLGRQVAIFENVANESSISLASLGKGLFTLVLVDSQNKGRHFEARHLRLE